MYHRAGAAAAPTHLPVPRMKLSIAIDTYIADMRAEGRINSPGTERSYRHVLELHAEDVANRDPRTTSRDDVKRTLRRWQNPNSQRTYRSILVSFYDWAMEEGLRRDNPARQTRRPRRRPTTTYRMTRQEVAAFLEAAQGIRERRIAFLGVGAGIRNAELRGLQGRHFHRPDWIWISPDIAKGGRERWIPILPELAPIVDDIRRYVAPGDYVIPAQRWRDPGLNTIQADVPARACSSQAVRSAVMRIAERAGIRAHIHPHLMRHAFGDHIARYAGMRIAQFLLGHADIGTTQTYTGPPTLDELKTAIEGFRLMDQHERVFYPQEVSSANPHEAPTGIEPVNSPIHALEPNLLAWLKSMDPTIDLYADHYRGS